MNDSSQFWFATVVIAGAGLLWTTPGCSESASPPAGSGSANENGGSSGDVPDETADDDNATTGTVADAGKKDEEQGKDAGTDAKAAGGDPPGTACNAATTCAPLTCACNDGTTIGPRQACISHKCPTQDVYCTYDPLATNAAPCGSHGGWAGN